jgi:hypothetical protein
MSRKRLPSRRHSSPLLRHLEALESRVLLSSALISQPDHNAVIYDPTRHQLDIAGTGGTLYRYDVITKQLVSSIQVGGRPSQGDITLDGQYLYLSDQNIDVIHKINLTTGADTDLSLDVPGEHVKASDLVVISSTQALIATYGSAGARSFYSLDLTSDTLRPITSGPLANVYNGLMLFPSADRSKILLYSFSTDGNPFYIYNVAQNATQGYGYHSSGLAGYGGAASRDGHLFTATDRTSLWVWDEFHTAVATFPTGNNYFSPTYDSLYLIENTSATVKIYDTNTFALKGTVDIGESWNMDFSGFPLGSMTATPDGKTLFITTPAGVRLVDVDETHMLRPTLSVSANGLFTGQSLTLTASLSSTPAPGATVVFRDGTLTLATLPATGTSVTYSSTLLAAGTHDFTASYVDLTSGTNFTSPTRPVVIRSRTDANLLGISSRTDLIYNATLGELDIPCSNGDILRYDPVLDQFKPALHFAAAFGRGDVTTDGKYLLVTDVPSNFIHKIDLNTGSDTRLPIATNDQFGWATDVVVVSNSRALVSTSGLSYNSIPTYSLDLTTDILTPITSGPLASISQRAVFYPSSDRNLLIVSGMIYNVTTNTTQGQYTLPNYASAAFNRDDSLYGARTNCGIWLWDIHQTLRATLPSGLTFCFSPTYNSLYVMDSNSSTLKIYDTTTFALKGTADLGQRWGGDASTNLGQMTTTTDGQTLFIVTDTGVRVVNVDETHILHPALNVSANDLLTGQTLTLTAGLTGTPAPGATIIFRDGTMTLATLPAAGTSVTYSNSLLATGVHDFTASYVDPTSGTNFTSPSQPVVIRSRTDTNLLAIPGRADLIYNPALGELDIPCANGDIFRYDPVLNQFRPALHVTATFGKGDVTTDGRFLYLTDTTADLLHKIDLTTGTDTTLSLDVAGLTEYATDVMVLSDAHAFVATADSDWGGKPMYDLDLTSDTLTPITSGPLANINQGTTFYPSADRSFLIVDGYIYNVAENATQGQFYCGLSAAISRDGSFCAAGGRGALSIRDPEGALVAALPAGYACLSPTFDSLYTIEKLSTQVKIYDTTTLTLKGTADFGESWNWDFNGAPLGSMTTTADGKTLFIVTPSGVRFVNVDESTMIRPALNVSANGLFTGQTLTLTANLNSTPAPGANVVFRDGTMTLATVPATGTTVTYSSTLLAAGAHDFTASYVIPTSGTNFTSLVRPVVIRSRADANLLSMPTHTDLIYNAALGELDIPCANGDIFRYDPLLDQFKPALHFATAFGRGDVTTDGRFLYLTDTAADLLHKINLTSGSDTTLSLDVAGRTEQARDVLVISGTRAFVAASDSDWGGKPMYDLDLTSDTLTPITSGPLASINQGAKLYPSADRSLFIASGLIYNVATNASQGQYTLPEYNSAAINRNNSLYGARTNSGLLFWDFQHTLLATLPTGLTFCFSPTYDSLYVMEDYSSTLKIYDTTNFALKGTADFGERWSWNADTDLGKMTTTPDGKTFFILTPAGVRFVNVNEGPFPVPSLGVSPASPAFGQTLTLTAQLDPNTYSTLDSIVFKDGTQTLGTGTINASGAASLAVSSLAVGSHSFTATYLCSNGMSGVASTPSNLTVTPTAPTLALSLASDVRPSSPPRLNITVSGIALAVPTGTIDIFENATLLGSATLTNGTLQYSLNAPLPLGTHTLTAHFQGDTNYLPADSSPLSIDVEQAPTTLTLTTPHSVEVPGSHITLQATVTATTSNLTGSVAFYSGDTLLGNATVDASGHASFITAALDAGDYQFSAVFAETTDYKSSTSSPLTVSIHPMPTTTTLAALHSVDAPGSHITLNATVSVASDHIAGNSISFYFGTTLLGNATVDASGHASFITAALDAGDYQFSAVFGATVAFAASTSQPLSVSIHPIATALAISTNSSHSTIGTPISFTATVTADSSLIPTGSVTFFDGSRSLGSASLDATGRATLPLNFTSAGTHQISAVYAGDASFLTSTSAAISQDVSLEYVIDLLAVYTPEEAYYAGDSILSTLQHEIDDANEAFANSEIPVTIRLVGLTEVNYRESGSLQKDWARLANPSDGYMDSVPKLRDALGADLVVLLDSQGTETNTGYIAGVGSQLTSLQNSARANCAYLVIDAGASESDYVLAHELGHTLGAAHALGDPGSSGLAADAHGYRFTGNDGDTYHDIMAYEPGELIPYYSDPDLSYAGQPIGKTGVANAARVIRMAAPAVAAYRTSTPVGAINSANASLITGWALDPKTFLDPATVKIEVDGQTLASLTADDDYQRLAPVFYNTEHGFSFVLPHLSSGKHTVRLYGIDSVSGQSVLLDTCTITADHFVFTTQPAAAIAGHPLANTVTVSVLDARGRLDSTYNGNLTLSIVNTNDTSSTGTLTVSIVDGVAAFPDLSLTKAGTYQLRATDGALNAIISKKFTISAEAASSHLVLVQQPTAGAVATNLLPKLTVQVQDQFGNLVLSNRSKLTLAIASGPSGGTLKGAVTATASRGIATFSRLSFSKAGDYSLTLSAAGLSSATPLQLSQTITPATALVTTPKVVAAGYAPGTIINLSCTLRSNPTAIPFSGAASLIDADGQVLTTSTPSLTGKLKFTVNNLTAGTYSCHIVYDNDPDHTLGTSSTFLLTIRLA